MILARSPLRITLGGGGTDLPSYCDVHGGFAIAAAIDAHVTVMVQEAPAEPGSGQPVGIDHQIARVAFDLLDIDPQKIVVTSVSDVPAGTGLGSSASFTTALLAALYRYRGISVGKAELAAAAASIEIDHLKLPVGSQDQYVAALGGLLAMEFGANRTVVARPLSIPAATLARLERELLLFYTGFSRPAAAVLADQDNRTRRAETAMLDNLHAVKALAFRSQDALLGGDCKGFGRLMDEHWQIKRQRSHGISNPAIDGWYRLARDSGATGGKLIGAGSGGFLMLHAPEPDTVRRVMKSARLRELRFRFQTTGTTVLQ
jgi:D-glycero-alpha-D-manno-heptose-7-phosphate kinase